MTEDQFKVAMKAEAETLGFSLHDLFHEKPNYVVSLRQGRTVYEYTIAYLDEDHAKLIGEALRQAGNAPAG